MKLIHLLMTTFFLCGFVLEAQAHGGTSSEEKEFDQMFSTDLTDLMNMRVTVASKKAENVSEAPSILSVVTAREIQQFGAKNLKEVLNRVPSIQGIGSHFHSNSISIRGQMRSHANRDILFLINGRPHRTSYSGGLHGSLLQAFPIETIERLEVIRGPGSVLYGTSAFSGVINIITKSAEKMDKTTLTTTYGSFNTLSEDAVGGWRGDDLGITLGLKAFKTDGWDFRAIDENNINDQTKMKETDFGSFGTLAYKNFELASLYTSYKQYNLGTGVKWPEGNETIRHLMLDGGFYHGIGTSWEADYHLTFNGLKFDVAPDRHRFADDISVEATFKGPVLDNLDLLFGGAYENQHGSPTAGISYLSHQSRLYAEAAYTPIDQLKLIVGANWNKVDNQTADISPRLGIIANFNKHWGAKLLYGEAYRSAYANERFATTPTLLGAPNLKPETIATSEAQIFYHDTNHYAALTYYHSKIEDIILRQRVAGPLFTFVNAGTITFDGVELEGKAMLTDALSLLGSATYQQNKDDTGLKNKTFTPNLMAKLGLNYEFLHGHSLSLFDTYFGKPTPTRDVDPTTSDVNPEPGAYHLISAKVTFSLTRLLEASDALDGTFSISVDNLLDKAIYYPEINRKNINSIPIYSGRAVYGTLRLTF